MGNAERSNPLNRWRQDEGILTTRAYDRFGRQINEGDLVMVMGKGDLIWKVRSVTPCLDPGVPAGVVALSLLALFETGVPGGTPISDVVKVRDIEEIKMPPKVSES